MSTADLRRIEHLKFSPDSKHIAACGGHVAKLLDMAGNERQRYVGHSQTVTGIAFSKDGETLATCSVDRNVRLWNTQNGACLRILRDTHRKFAPWPSLPTAINWHRWEWINKFALAMVITEQSRELTGHADSVWSVHTPGRSSVATASADRTIKIWSAETGEVTATLTGHAAPVTVATFARTGARILSGAGDNVLRVWDAVSGKLLRTFEGHRRPITAAAFSPDAKPHRLRFRGWLVKVWERMPGKELATLVGHQRQWLSLSTRRQTKSRQAAAI